MIYSNYTYYKSDKFFGHEYLVLAMLDGDVHAHHQLPITCLLHLAHVQTRLLEVIIAAADEHLQLVVQ